jgi:hypothetical protein
MPSASAGADISTTAPKAMDILCKLITVSPVVGRRSTHKSC